ncbi:MAG: lactate dehydrogenase, partial [Anaerotignum sp.]
IPPVGSAVQDVRMAQFEANRGIISLFAKKARAAQFAGLFAVVSDPVDPLCKTAFLSSNEGEEGKFDGKGLRPEQVQGYGLGVMNARAAYYAKQDARFSSFLTEGRAFGPHGEDLVIANSISAYDDALSKELSRLAVEANLRTRELGFKPYVAPAISSAALSILLTLRGEWHYSSNFLGGVYMGCKNRTTEYGLEMEALPLPEALFRRIERAYQNLEAIL